MAAAISVVARPTIGIPIAIASTTASPRLAGRVVFEGDPGQGPLLVREDLVPVFEVILARLEQDAVELQVADGVGRHVADVVAERERGPSAAVALVPAGPDGQVELDSGAG